MRTGCQWNVLPIEFGDDSSVHRTFVRWIKKGVLERVWARLIESCEELGGVAVPLAGGRHGDGQGPFGGGIKSAPTRRIERKTAPSMAS